MVDEVDFAVGHVDAGGMIPLVASAIYNEPQHPD